MLRADVASAVNQPSRRKSHAPIITPIKSTLPISPVTSNQTQCSELVSAIVRLLADHGNVKLETVLSSQPGRAQWPLLGGAALNNNVREFLHNVAHHGRTTVAAHLLQNLDDALKLLASDAEGGWTFPALRRASHDTPLYTHELFLKQYATRGEFDPLARFSEIELRVTLKWLASKLHPRSGDQIEILHSGDTRGYIYYALYRKVILVVIFSLVLLLICHVVRSLRQFLRLSAMPALRRNTSTFPAVHSPRNVGNKANQC
jgi:hypothetical protein